MGDDDDGETDRRLGAGRLIADRDTKSDARVPVGTVNGGAVVCRRRRRRRHQLFSYGACVSARIVVVASFALVVRSADRRTRHRVYRRISCRYVAVSAVSVMII